MINLSFGWQGAGTSNRQNAGFTLIEVLIAVSLLSIIMLILFSGLRLAGRSWDKGEERAVQISNQVMVSTFLQQYISTARPIMDDISTEEGDDPQFSFIGASNGLRFVASLPSYRGRGGLHFFYLRLVEPEDPDLPGMDLILTLWPFFPLNDDAEPVMEELVLLQGIERIEFHYYGQEEGEDEMQWLDEWSGRIVMPRLVQINLEFTDGRYWPTMFIRPKVDASLS